MRLDDRVWSISTIDGVLEVQPHDIVEPDASLHTDPGTLDALLMDPGDG